MCKGVHTCCLFRGGKEAGMGLIATERAIKVSRSVNKNSGGSRRSVRVHSTFRECDTAILQDKNREKSKRKGKKNRENNMKEQRRTMREKQSENHRQEQDKQGTKIMDVKVNPSWCH